MNHRIEVEENYSELCGPSIPNLHRSVKGGVKNTEKIRCSDVMILLYQELSTVGFVQLYSEKTTLTLKARALNAGPVMQ